MNVNRIFNIEHHEAPAMHSKKPILSARTETDVEEGLKLTSNRDSQFLCAVPICYTFSYDIANQIRFLTSWKPQSNLLAPQFEKT